MSKPLVFMMGRSPAFLPVDRQYARNHLWVVRTEKGHRLGFSSFAVKLLGELQHVEWSVGEDAAVEQGRAIGYTEASKATSDIYAPLSGSVIEINPRVLADPTLINTSPYDAGWLLTLAGEATGLLAPEQYAAYLETTWPLAQRLLKGQAGKGRY